MPSDVLPDFINLINVDVDVDVDVDVEASKQTTDQKKLVILSRVRTCGLRELT